MTHLLRFSLVVATSSITLPGSYANSLQPSPSYFQEGGSLLEDPPEGDAVHDEETQRDYYHAVDTSSTAQLRLTLHNTIDDHIRFQYTSNRQGVRDTWDILHEADADPDYRNSIRDLYKNAVYKIERGDNGFYNREHVWPKSYGFPDNGPGNAPYTDCHHLFLCNTAFNNARGNFLYGPADVNEFPTEFTEAMLQGRDLSNWNDPSNELWSTWRDRRGDVARALFYMDVRYEGGTSETVRGGREPDLILTNDASLVRKTVGTSNPSMAYMGLLDTLIEWHYQDPVDDRERHHNDVVHKYQKNRNPFVDHPEYVSLLFLSEAERISLRYPLRNDLSDVIQLSEVHYTNQGDDRHEFVELTGVAGTSVSNMMIVGYNVSTGRAYRSMALAGSIPNERNSRGALAFDFGGFQNDAGDALALVNGDGRLLEFISFGGTIDRALDGPAAGYASTDVGVAEDESSRAGASLQLLDAGWAGPIAMTRGKLNEPGEERSMEELR